MDRFDCFADLQRVFREENHYRRTILDRAGPLVILAPHGGGIEPGTSELARAVAGEEFSLYLFEAVLRSTSGSRDLHITSTRFDEPRCLALVGRHTTSLALHGCDDHESLIYVGGLDERLRDHLASGLAARGYSVKIGAGEFAGRESANLCNRTRSGMGVQLELSKGLRAQFFEKLSTRTGRQTRTPLFARFVADLRDMLR